MLRKIINDKFIYPVLMVVIFLMSIHSVIFLFLSPVTHQKLLMRLSFIPAYSLENDVWYTLLSYHLVHIGWIHLFINSVLFLIFGIMVAMRLKSTLCFLLFYISSSIFAIILYWIFCRESVIPVQGIFIVISAMFGATTRFAFSPSCKGWHKEWQFGTRVPHIMSFKETILCRPTQGIILLWMLLNVLMFVVDVSFDIHHIFTIWLVNIPGFISGFLLFDLFDQGGLSESGHSTVVKYGEWLGSRQDDDNMS